MALTRIQLGEVPGNPGGLGTVQQGSNTVISRGEIIAAGTGVSRVLEGANVSVTPQIGTGDVTVSSLISDPIVDATDDDFPSGTQLFFFQQSAPTGWTKQATNEATIRVVSSAGGGSGGSANFTDVFGVQTFSGTCTAAFTFGGTTDEVTLTPGGSTSVTFSLTGTAITQVQMGAHTHTVNNISQPSGTQGKLNDTGNFTPNKGIVSSNYGADQAHTHTVTATIPIVSAGSVTHDHSIATPATGSGTFIGGNSMDLRVKYIDCIMCRKN